MTINRPDGQGGWHKLVAESSNRLNGELPSSDATESTVVTRDSEGRAKIQSPATDLDIANKEYVDKALPQGCIVMWSGTIDNIPQGFHICDGNNGTPNLLDRFILGVSSQEEPGGSGGSHLKTISTNQLPSHKHSFTTDIQDSDHKHSVSVDNESVVHSHSVTINEDGNHTHTGRWRKFSGISPSSAGWIVARRIHSDDAFDGTNQIANSGGGHTHSASSGNDNITHNHSTTVGNQDSNHKHEGNTNNTGTGANFDVRPSYYKLAFIIKL